MHAHASSHAFLDNAGTQTQSTSSTSRTMKFIRARDQRRDDKVQNRVCANDHIASQSRLWLGFGGSSRQRSLPRQPPCRRIIESQDKRSRSSIRLAQPTTSTEAHVHPSLAQSLSDSQVCNHAPHAKRWFRVTRSTRGRSVG